MKFNVSSSQLLTQLQAVNKVILGKNAISIFDNFYLSLNGEQLTVKGSDQENVLIATVDVTEAEGEGAICLNAKKILDSLKEAPNQGLTFYINESTQEVEIKYLNGRFRMVGVSADQYPQNDEEVEEQIELSIPAENLIKALDTTLYAVSVDTTRPAMTGIYWDIHPEDITFVTTDTHKLVKYVDKEVHTGLEHHFIMPAKPAAILRSILTKESGDLTVKASSRSLRFTWASFALECRLIQNNYPNYNRVIPQGNPFTLTVDRQTMLSSMRRAAIYASMASFLVKCNVQPNEVIVSTGENDNGSSDEEKLTCDYNGNSMVIGFNVNYIIELLSNIKGDNIVVRLADPALPALFEPGEPAEGSETIMLLMPMKISEGF